MLTQETKDWCCPLHDLWVRTFTKERLSNLLLDNPVSQTDCVEILRRSHLLAANAYDVVELSNLLSSMFVHSLCLIFLHSSLLVQSHSCFDSFDQLADVADTLEPFLKVCDLEKARGERELDLFYQLCDFIIALGDLKEGSEGLQRSWENVLVELLDFLISHAEQPLCYYFLNLLNEVGGKRLRKKSSTIQECSCQITQELQRHQLFLHLACFSVIAWLLCPCVSSSEQSEECCEASKLSKIVKEVQSMTKDQIVSSCCDAPTELVNIYILINRDSSLHQVTLKRLCYWLLEILLILVKVQIEPQCPMTATEEPLQNPHELASTHQQGSIFIHKEEVSIPIQLWQALFQQFRCFLEPMHNQTEHCLYEVADLGNFILGIGISGQQEVDGDE